jgi:manganese/iron transport system permease protein
MVFYLTVGIGISLTTRFVGDVFTFAYLILPASISILIAKRVVNVFMISVLVGGILPPISIYFAFELDISSGPTAVVTAFIVFLTVYLFKKIKK